MYKTLVENWEKHLQNVSLISYSMHELWSQFKIKDCMIQQTNLFWKGKKQPNYLQYFIQISYYLQG